MNVDRITPNEYTDPVEAIFALLERMDNRPLRVARYLGINDAHVYLARKKTITPLLQKRLQEVGLYKKETRYRAHVEFGRGEEGERRKKEFEEWLDSNGWKNLTEAIDDLMGGNQ